MSQLERAGEGLHNPVSPVDHKLLETTQSSTYKKKKPSFAGPQTIVTINTTNEDATKKQKFLVHKEFICHYSPFFSAAFNGSFMEGKSQTMELEDVEPAVFAFFVNWIYAQKVLSDQEDDQPSLAQLINLWILADRLLIPKLQNQVLAAYDRKRLSVHERPASRTVGHIYKNTSPESPLRKYIIQILASTNWGGSVAEPKWEYYPKELLIDMIRSMKANDFKRTWVKFSEEELKQFFVKEEASGQKEEEREI